MPEIDTQHTQHAQLTVIVQTLFREYNWQLLTERQVSEVVLSQLTDAPAFTPEQLRTFAIKEYSRQGMYPACLGVLGVSTRKQGFEELWQYLYRVANYKWPQIAQEVVQETVVTLHTKIHDCRKPEMFLFFAYQKLRDTAKKFQRRATQERSLDQLLEEDVYGNLEAASSLVGQDAEQMEETVLQTDLWRQAGEALRRLRQAQPRAGRQLDAVWLRYMQGMATSISQVSFLQAQSEAPYQQFALCRKVIVSSVL